MDENRAEHKQELEIDIQHLTGAILQKFWLIVLAALLGALIAFLGTFFFVTPQYESSAMFYVNNNSLSVGEASLSLTSSDITASKSLVDSYIVIMQTRASLVDVIDYAGVDRTYDELTRMISASAVNSTEIFKVVVTSPDPLEAEKIANAIAYILPKRIASIIEGTSAKVVDAAVVAARPSSPNYMVNIFVGFALGVTLAVSYIILRAVFDTTIHGEEDITMCTGHPILASVPDMDAPSKGSYYSYGAHKPPNGKSAPPGGKQIPQVGSGIGFAASEAYKLLRTRLQFSFADDSDCRIIGVSSALSGEGKSLTAVNLAHSLSQLGEKVLLIDCDMRRPSLSIKLPISKSPGLSNFLSGQSGQEGLFQFCGLEGEEKAFVVVAAGRNPPNPVELISSARMKRMLEALRKPYDYIILDLPPVGEVSDALAVAKCTDGMLMVARQNYGDRVSFTSALRQFEAVDAKILGVVLNASVEGNGAYGKKYKRYYQRQSG